jgi:hypothetical protein
MQTIGNTLAGRRVLAYHVDVTGHQLAGIVFQDLGADPLANLKVRCIARVPGARRDPGMRRQA